MSIHNTYTNDDKDKINGTNDYCTSQREYNASPYTKYIKRSEKARNNKVTFRLGSDENTNDSTNGVTTTNANTATEATVYRKNDRQSRSLNGLKNDNINNIDAISIEHKNRSHNECTEKEKYEAITKPNTTNAKAATEAAVYRGNERHSHSKNESTKDSIDNTDVISDKHRSYNLNAETTPGRKIKQINKEQSHFNTQMNSLIRSLGTYFPEEAKGEKRNQLREVARKSYSLADEVFHAQDAEKWGNGFLVSDELVNSDENLFKASMRDLTVMTSRRQKELSPNRLNRQRVEKYIRVENPEREKLLILADKGMPLLLRPGFKANGRGQLPPLRRTYTAVKSAVNRLLVENFHELGLAFILRKETALEIEGIHFSPLHWTEKQGKRQGRPIGDCSDGGNEVGNEPLNSDYTKEMSDMAWGTIKHPSIDDAARMIIAYFERAKLEDTATQWEDIVILKKDLRGAFTLLFYEASGVNKLAMEMTEDRVIIFICGIFGWTGTPAAFQVINRALVYEIKHAIKGDIIMYSDDILIVTSRKHLTSDSYITDNICTNLMGPNSVETSKTESGRLLSFIGYDIDLDMERITISERNILRTMYAFLTVDFSQPMKVKTMQKLASLASRSSKINSYMKPFVNVLYAEYAGRGDHVSFTLSVRAGRVICLLRVFLGLTAINRTKFSRPLSSFCTEIAEVTIEFDASLTGIGLLYFKNNNGTETLIGGGAVDTSSLNFESNAAYQNTAEFIAAVMGIRGLTHLNLKPRSVNLRGDSITALTWAETGKFKGELVGNAAVIFILQGLYRNITINKVIHLAAAENWRTDFLSRGGTIEKLLERDPHLGLPKVIDLNGDEIIQLCNPNVSTSSEKDFNDFWARARRTLESDS